MLLPYRDELLEEVERLRVVRHVVPVEPRNLVVLAVGVVVPSLRPSYLVPCDEHRRSLRNHQRREEILYLPLARLVYLRVDDGALEPVVVAEVVVVPVAVVLAVLLVVLVVVRHEVVEREAVVRRDEIYRMRRVPSRKREQVARAGNPRRRLRGKVRVAADEPPYPVTVLVVPFAPAVVRAAGEASDLVRAAAIPRLRDNLRVPQDGILRDSLREGALLEGEPALVAGEN